MMSKNFCQTLRIQTQCVSLRNTDYKLQLYIVYEKKKKHCNCISVQVNVHRKKNERKRMKRSLNKSSPRPQSYIDIHINHPT